MAVSVSWFGVRGVLRSEFVDDVRVQPMAANTVAAHHDDRAAQQETTPTPTPRRTQKKTPEPKPEPEATPTKTPTPTRAKSTGDVKVVTVKGGEVAFTIGSAGCKLVSATPNSGYTAKVSRNDKWIRVDLVQGEHGSAVFCIGDERRTDTWEY